MIRDADVRRVLHKRVLHEHHDDADTIVIDELPVWSGSARIDVAVVNGSMSGFEIKSDADTLERLPNQIILYSYVFDFMTLVVGEKLATKATKLVPTLWGISVARNEKGSVCLEKIREPLQNEDVNDVILLDMLTRPEIISILNSNVGEATRSTHRLRHLVAEAYESLPPQLLRSSVRETLKGRSDWLGQHIGD